ncbi:MAG: SPFH/Band 7/PHB domain protein, partial [Elusimicrobiaceae bacterium]|nr:SPFH/Band 7/PHB domain protein [Elusimicrobiaceae bacterium]
MEEMAGVGIIFLGAFAFFIIVMIFKGIVIVKEGQRVIIERLGKFSDVLDPGFNWIIPILDKPHRMEWRSSREYVDVSGRSRSVPYTEYRDVVDMRETVYDFPRQNVITRDNVSIQINALLYFQVTNPQDAAYKVESLPT